MELELELAVSSGQRAKSAPNYFPRRGVSIRYAASELALYPDFKDRYQVAA